MMEVVGRGRILEFREDPMPDGSTLAMLSVFAGGELLQFYVPPDTPPEVRDVLRTRKDLPEFEFTIGLGNRQKGGKSARILALGKEVKAQ